MAKRKLAKLEPIRKNEHPSTEIADTETEESVSESTEADTQLEEVDEPEADDSPEYSPVDTQTLRNNLVSARIRRDKETEAAILKVLGEINTSIAIEIPVAPLEDSGYGVSARHISRFLKHQRISHEQGVALGRIQSAMTNAGEKLKSGKNVTSKENVICRLLELAHEALD